MSMAEVLFCILFAIIFYTYVGYAVVVWIWAGIAGLGKGEETNFFEPGVTVVVPAYNEANILDEKVLNCLALDYPSEKIKFIFITDGSTDQSDKVLVAYSEVMHLHIPQRGGKTMAENRAIQYVSTPYVVFTDCNTLLNPDAIRKLIRHYRDPRVGAVSGEKRVLSDGGTAGSGEGLYWKYESFLKKCDSSIYSLMGAAGELVSFRTDLFAPLEVDTILDDFVQSMRIVDAGYRVIYEPQAYAMEKPSFSLSEEMKRKVRICAGGWQAMARLLPLLNPLRRPVVSFLYFSHRVLRWSITPVTLLLLLPLNAYLSYCQGGVYSVLFGLQALFYAAAALGWWRSAQGIPAGPLVVPLYFTLMNVAVFQGFGRFLRNSQPAAWEKAQRFAS